MMQHYKRERSFRISSKPFDNQTTVIGFRSKSKTSLPSSFCQELLNQKTQKNFRITQLLPRRTISKKPRQNVQQRNQYESTIAPAVIPKAKTPNHSSLLERRGIINEIQKIYFHLQLDQTNFDIKPTVQSTKDIENNIGPTVQSTRNIETNIGTNPSNRFKNAYEKFCQQKIQIILQQPNKRKMNQN